MCTVYTGYRLILNFFKDGGDFTLFYLLTSLENVDIINIETDEKYVNKKERERHLPGYCQ